MKTYNLNKINESLNKKLSRQEKDLLLSVLNDLKKAEKYILKEEIVFGTKQKMSYGDSYINKDGESIGIYNKHVGSELCYLYNAVRSLNGLLTPLPVEEITL